MLAVIPRGGYQIDHSIIRSFRKLASCGMVPPGSKPGHPDGWGIVSWINGIPEYLGREPLDALTDSRYEEACNRIETDGIRSPVLVHLRKASGGLKTRENTHPFVSGEWAFVHNGTIRKLNLKVRTDSEWFFESLMRKYNQKFDRDMQRAIADQINETREIYPYTSITFILSNGKELYAYRDSTKNREYYGMHYTMTGNSLVISQERFFESDWTELDNGIALHVAPDGFQEIFHYGDYLKAAA